MATVPPLPEAGSLEAQAHQSLVDWLVNEHPEPGQPVPIREFARTLGMSRTPVRSAVGRLYERGLLAYDSTTGFTVAIPSLSSIYELFEVRLMIESHSIRRYCQQHPNGIPDDVTALVDEAADLASRAIDDQAAYIAFRDNDSRFHRRLVELSELPRLQEMHNDLHLSIHVTRAGMEAPLTADRLNTAVAEHRAVTDALSKGDAATAQDALESHILRVRDQTIVFLSRPRVGAQLR